MAPTTVRFAESDYRDNIAFWATIWSDEAINKSGNSELAILEVVKPKMKTINHFSSIEYGQVQVNLYTNNVIGGIRKFSQFQFVMNHGRWSSFLFRKNTTNQTKTEIDALNAF